MAAQGLLEGVKGELDQLDPWVGEDVETVRNAAINMAVILNDVLDLGQVWAAPSSPRPAPSRVVVLVALLTPAHALFAVLHVTPLPTHCSLSHTVATGPAEFEPGAN